MCALFLTIRFMNFSQEASVRMYQHNHAYTQTYVFLKKTCFLFFWKKRRFLLFFIIKNRLGPAMGHHVSAPAARWQSGQPAQSSGTGGNSANGRLAHN